MLTTEPTVEMMSKWKETFYKYRNSLQPNRKTGEEINEYFFKKYKPDKFDSVKFANVVKDNILLNEYNKEKLPIGTEPQIASYKTDNCIVGIDLVSGFIHVESKDITKASEIYDDLFFFRGLDEKDLNNYFLVAQYIELKQKPTK